MVIHVDRLTIAAGGGYRILAVEGVGELFPKTKDNYAATRCPLYELSFTGGVSCQSRGVISLASA
jgi:hypothetical protein